MSIWCVSFCRTYVIMMHQMNCVIFGPQVTMSSACVSGFTKMLYCSYCQGLFTLKPCNNYCLNVMKGCLANQADLDPEWSKYIGKSLFIPLTKRVKCMSAPEIWPGIVDFLIGLGWSIVSYRDLSSGHFYSIWIHHTTRASHCMCDVWKNGRVSSDAQTQTHRVFSICVSIYEDMNIISRAALRVSSPASHHFMLPSCTQKLKDLHYKRKYITTVYFSM